MQRLHRASGGKQPLGRIDVTGVVVEHPAVPVAGDLSRQNVGEVLEGVQGGDDLAGQGVEVGATLSAIVRDVFASLKHAGIPKLVVTNGHGGNYVLSNIVQEANLGDRQMLLYPRGEDWDDARRVAGLDTNNHEDMHGGEAETSILLANAPEMVRPSYVDADFDVRDRRYLLTTGMAGYTKSGIIGRPSVATAEKGRALLDAFSATFRNHLAQLQ